MSLFFILILGILFLMVGIIFSQLLYETGNRKGCRITIPMFFVGVLLCIWSACAINQTPVVEKTIEFSSQSINEIDLIIDEEKVVNLNKYFGQRVEEGTVIEKVIYLDGPYLGLYGTIKYPDYRIKVENEKVSK